MSGLGTWSVWQVPLHSSALATSARFAELVDEVVFHAFLPSVKRQCLGPPTGRLHVCVPLGFSVLCFYFAAHVNEVYMIYYRIAVSFQ